MLGNSSNQQLRRRYGSESEENAADSYVIPSSNGSTTKIYNNNSSNSLTMMTPSSNSTCSTSRSSRDRTAEFFNTVKSLQSRQQYRQPPPANGQLNNRSTLRAQSGQFMKIAQSIGKDIASTYTKLEKLTLLAKRKTIFDDRPQEIQELTYIIKEDMNCLNRQIGQLQQIARSQKISGGKHQQSHSSSVVVALQSKLASMTSNFKSVLELRTENLKESKSRQEKFSQGNVTHSLPQSAVIGYHSGSVLASSTFENGDDTSIAIPMNETMQQQVHMENEHSYLQNRADTMQNIESTIVELGGIFSQLAHMIKEQEEIMVRIDSNVEDTAMNVEAGHGEILKYFQSVTSNRWLMVKIFGVLIFFFIFFAIFLA